MEEKTYTIYFPYGYKGQKKASLKDCLKETSNYSCPDIKTLWNRFPVDGEELTMEQIRKEIADNRLAIFPVHKSYSMEQLRNMCNMDFKIALMRYSDFRDFMKDFEG